MLSTPQHARATAGQGGANAEGVNLGNVARLAKSTRVLYIDNKQPAITRPGKGGYGTWDLTTHILCPANETLNPNGDAFNLTFANQQRVVRVRIPIEKHHDVMSFILKHTTPLAHARADMPYVKQDMLHDALLQCGLQAKY